VVSQGTALVLASMIVVARGERPGGSFVLYAAIAGLSEAVGVAALYRGLAVGAMSIVALVGGAIAPVVPVLVGILLGEFPTPIHGAGIVLAVAEIAITSWGRRSADAVAAGGLASSRSAPGDRSLEGLRCPGGRLSTEPSVIV
jgi:drug/metabolite transporter (DMT)-like permease